MTKLCPRGKAAAKRKFAVYPSAYANAYASKICAGKIKDPSGTKRKDFRGPKPAGAKVGMAVTAGAQSGMGRLQKSGLMKPKMMNRGGGFDAGTPGKLRDIASRYESDGIKFKPGKGPKTTPDRRRRLQSVIDKRNKKEKIKDAFKKAVSVATPITGGISAGKKIIDKIKSSKTKESSTGQGGAMQRGKQNRRPVKKIPVMEAKKGKMTIMIAVGKPVKKSVGGDTKIKKVIKGLNKASKLHAGQAKSLGTLVNKKSIGGMARGSGAAIRGTNFQGVF